MNMRDELAAYKAKVDARYASMKDIRLPTKAEHDGEIRNRPPDWLLLSPTHVIEGVASGRHFATASDAFDCFFETGRGRAVREGYRVVRDTEDHRWFEEYASGGNRRVVWSPA